MESVKHFLFVTIFSVSLLSCSDNYVYNGYITLPNESWHVDSIAQFNVPVSDTLTYYNLFINIRNTTDYPYQNLYLFIDVKAPNGSAIRDTFECFLSDEHGNWYGKGSGSLRDNRFLYRKNVRFGTSGEYKVYLQQAMRVDELKGISEVGFRVELGDKN
ncbi:gliding motility lipoprotein GldH [Tenuifilum thalassicum]|uniref:Gliding motility lipoprotein GldH n=1 Tax=Tenuifilum thalassicum TaxID=2590900 RepID=A0A7D3Y2J3_9BACT|nr:gliding motility lipoprotein GldH [Tenuifilum thalassicum]QKG78869.1 gliding motility lipoprotein GldH [Tenuifilum thalassicum]